MQKISILGLGSRIPDAVVTNADLAKRVDTTDEWITTRTGIKQRHILARDETNTELGAVAAERALADANLAPSDITHILVATCTGDYITPSASCLIADRIGIKGRYALDINAACSGFLYGLETAAGLIAMKPQAKVLLIAAEALSHRINWEDRSTCVLFGDGGAAMVLAAGTEKPAKQVGSLVDIETASDGSLGPLLHFGGQPESGEPYRIGSPLGPEFFVQMNGREVFKHAVRNMAAISTEVLQRNGLTVADLDLVVPHQANSRIIEAVASRLQVPEDTVYTNLPRTGNTSAVSIPLALDDARREGRLKPGMKVLACTFGGGLTWSAALFQF
ncbi:MAG: 3-oxoacyl-[acyl-carrier-protein] synthase 3 [Desulfovibrio sp.]